MFAYVEIYSTIYGKPVKGGVGDGVVTGGIVVGNVSGVVVGGVVAGDVVGVVTIPEENLMIILF